MTKEQEQGVKNIEILAAKGKKTTGYEKEMQELHDLTFDLRHGSIKELKLRVKDTIQLYPGLMVYKEVI